MVFADPPGLIGAKGQAFRALLSKKDYGSAPPFPFYAGAAYDDVYLITQAISSVGDDTTKVEQYLHSIPNYVGTVGTYSFDQNGDMVGIGALFQKIEADVANWPPCNVMSINYKTALQRAVFMVQLCRLDHVYGHNSSTHPQ